MANPIQLYLVDLNNDRLPVVIQRLDYFRKTRDDITQTGLRDIYTTKISEIEGLKNELSSERDELENKNIDIVREKGEIETLKGELDSANFLGAVASLNDADKLDKANELANKIEPFNQLVAEAKQLKADIEKNFATINSLLVSFGKQLKQTIEKISKNAKDALEAEANKLRLEREETQRQETQRQEVKAKAEEAVAVAAKAKAEAAKAEADAKAAAATKEKAEAAAAAAVAAAEEAEANRLRTVAEANILKVEREETQRQRLEEAERQRLEEAERQGLEDRINRQRLEDRINRQMQLLRDGNPVALKALNEKIEEQERIIQESQRPVLSFFEPKATKKEREKKLEVAEYNLIILKEKLENINANTFSPLKLKKKKKPSSPLKKKKKPSSPLKKKKKPSSPLKKKKSKKKKSKKQ